MMRMMNIASGSKGNATYVGNNHTHILLDCGVSRRRILEGLRRLDLSLDDLTAILITHEHSDHICSLGILERTREIPVYTTQGTARALQDTDVLGMAGGLLQMITPKETFRIGDIEILPLPTSHDAAQPVCYRLSEGTSSCAVVTDLGTYDTDLIQQLQGLKALLLEANHDVRMLETGPYPYSLKRRIASSTGHLSNEDSGRLLARLLHEKIRYVALGHLSPRNNTRDLAKLAVAYELTQSPYMEALPGFIPQLDIQIADQESGTDIYEF